MIRENAPEGTPDRQQGSLFSFEKGNKVTTHLENIDISNGLAWSEDNSIMYYIDSIPRKVYAFDFDLAAGKLSMCILSLHGFSTHSYLRCSFSTHVQHTCA